MSGLPYLSPIGVTRSLVTPPKPKQQRPWYHPRVEKPTNRKLWADDLTADSPTSLHVWAACYADVADAVDGRAAFRVRFDTKMDITGDITRAVHLAVSPDVDADGTLSLPTPMLMSTQLPT